MSDVERGSATTPRSPREVRPPTPEQIRAARNKLPETPAAPPPKDPRNLDYDEHCHCCLRVGATWLICGKKRGRWPLQWFVGPDWCCMLCTYTLVLVPTVAFIIFIGEHHWAARYGAVLTGSGATLVAFSSAACSDPGVRYREAGQEETEPTCIAVDGATSSGRTRLGRYECQVCVDDLDHHCRGWCGGWASAIEVASMARGVRNFFVLDRSSSRLPGASVCICGRRGDAVFAVNSCNLLVRHRGHDRCAGRRPRPA